ncbi:restriction endonuclease subunit S [Staphylococcus saprophyticus]
MDEKEVSKNDILLTSEAPLGESLFWDSDEKIVLSQRVFGLKPNTDIVNPKYLFAYLQTPKFKHELTSRESGTTVTGIRRKELEKTIIEVPSQNIQKFIGDLFYITNKKIKNNQNIIANLEELSQTLFKHWFVDFEFPDENGNSYKSSGGEMIDSELGIIPKLWNIKRLSDICIVTDGTHDSPKQTTEGYPLVTSKHLNKFDIDFSTTKLISKEDFTSINQRSKVEKNDILLSMIGTIGKLHFVNSNSINYAIKNVGLIKTSQIDYSTYIYNYINSQNTIDYIQQRTSGSTQQYISLKNLRSIPIISPTSNILKTYIDRNNNFFEKINQKIKENVKLIELRNTLLPKLMSGELEIPDDIEVNEDELSI